MENEYDIVIIGGGPAGCAAAQNASLKDYRTLVLERNLFPRDKICGDAIAFTSLDLLSDINFPIDKIRHHPNFSVEKTIQLYTSSDKNISINNNFFFTLPRKIFDEILWKNLSAQIQKQQQIEIKNITQTEDGFTINFNHHHQKLSIKTKYLIGADGYSSYVKRIFFNDLKTESRVASRYYFDSKKVLTNSFDFYFYPQIAPGYFWIFKVGENLYNTGVYLKKNETGNKVFEIHQKFMKELFNLFISKNEFKTWPIPNNKNFENLTHNNCLLVGDAAGICDEFLGQGIDSALISGKTAIDSIHFYETQNEKKYSLNEVYRYQLNSKIGKMLNGSNEIYKAIESNPENAYHIIKENYHHII